MNCFLTLIDISCDDRYYRSGANEQWHLYWGSLDCGYLFGLCSYIRVRSASIVLRPYYYIHMLCA